MYKENYKYFMKHGAISNYIECIHEICEDYKHTYINIFLLYFCEFAGEAAIGMLVNIKITLI